MLIDGTSVPNFFATTADQTYQHTAGGTVTADQIRIEFLNDELDRGAGIDSNLVVDYIRVDGTTFETEAPTTFSTGTWLPADGISPGFRLSEYLHTNGYFQYLAGQNNDGSEIEVRARGDEGTEEFRLLVDGTAVANFSATTSDQTYLYTASGTVTADQIRVEFLNDELDRTAGIDTRLTRR